MERKRTNFLFLSFYLSKAISSGISKFEAISARFSYNVILESGCREVKGGNYGLNLHLKAAF